MRKFMFATMLVLAVVFVILAVISGVKGDRLDMRLNLLWAMACLLECKIEFLHGVVSSQGEVIGKIVEVIGKIVRVKP